MQKPTKIKLAIFAVVTIVLIGTFACEKRRIKKQKEEENPKSHRECRVIKIAAESNQFKF